MAEETHLGMLDGSHSSTEVYIQRREDRLSKPLQRTSCKPLLTIVPLDFVPSIEFYGMKSANCQRRDSSFILSNVFFFFPLPLLSAVLIGGSLYNCSSGISSLAPTFSF